MTPFDTARYDAFAGGADVIPDTARSTPSQAKARAPGEPGATDRRSAALADAPAEAEEGGPREGALARLDRLVQTLVDRYRSLRGERDALRAELAEREERIRSLDARLAELAHSREEALKRLEQVLDRVDRLDAQMASSTAATVASPPE